MKVDAIGTVPTFKDIGINPNPVDAGTVWKETENLEVPNAVDISTMALEERTNRSVEQIRKEFAESQKQQNEWRDRIVKMNMAQAADTIPDDEARINALARQFNAPTEMVRNYRQLFEAQARDQKLSELPATHPKTTDFLSDPNNARIAHDDIDNIMELESLVTNPDGFTIAGDFGDRAAGAEFAPLEFMFDLARNLTAGAIGGGIKTVGGIGSFIARAIPVTGISDPEANLYAPELAMRQPELYKEAEKTGQKLSDMIGANRVYRFGEKTTEFLSGNTVNKYTFFGRAIQQGTQSLGALGPAVVGSILTRNPAFALSWAGLSEGSEAFMEDVGKGKDFSKATAHALFNSLVEVGTEYIPMSRLIKDAAIGTPFIKAFMRNWAAETPTEMAATALQTLSDKIADKKKWQDIGDVFMEWLEELPKAELETAIAVIPMSFGFSGAARISQIRASQATEKGIKSLNNSAASSKLRGRSAEVYKTLVSTQTEGTSLENAYINADAWQTYFQQQGLDPKEQAERYGVTNYDEAVTTGTDLTIPFPEYQSDFSASDHAPYFLRDTKLSEKGMTVNERETYLQRLEEQARETEELLERIGKESENARAVNDILSELTDEVAIQLESRYDKKTARTQATIAARAFMNPVYRDIVERAREKGQELSPDDIAGEIRDQFVRYGLTVNANATPTTVNTRKNIDPAIDSQLDKLRRNELPKESDVYGQSLMEYIRKKGGIRPDNITRDLVKNKQLPRSILNEKGMGADELAALQDVLDFGLDTETMQGDNALLDALVAEYTTGEKRYSNTQLNSELLSEAQALNDLSRDLAAAGIDLSNTDNAAIREALSKYYEEQNGENTREEPEASETLRYEQRGFTESDTPTTEERAEANRQYDEIEKKYRRTPLWMKAPNGEPTKLTERQWVQVRTPNFKRWFGDWEKAGIRERLEGQEPIPVKSKFTEETARIKKSEAAALLKEPFSVKKNIGEVFVTRNGIRESIGHSRNAAKLDVIPHLKEILEKAEYLDTLNDFDGKDIRNHYFAARIEHAGKTKLVFLRVRKAEGRNNQLYVHDVFVENEIKEKASSETNRRLNNPVRESLRNTDLYKSILQDIYATDNESVSKVVDENGEPRVVYHGTNEDYNAFDDSLIGSNTGNEGHAGRGFYFADTAYEASYYGNYVMPVFLNIRNPADFNKKSTISEYASQFGYKKEPVRINKEWLLGALKKKDESAYLFANDILNNGIGYEDAFERHYSDYSKSRIIDPNDVYDWVRYAENTRNSINFDFLNQTIVPVLGRPVIDEDYTYLPSSVAYLTEAGLYARNLTENIKNKGGDGVFAGTEIVAFEPGQIKSAIGNIGTFSENQNILYQFIGEKGATALDRANEATIRLDNLSIAREMETAGKDAKAIKFATGWERGADGKWRYEIEDKGRIGHLSGIDINILKKQVTSAERKLKTAKKRLEEARKRGDTEGTDKALDERYTMADALDRATTRLNIRNALENGQVYSAQLRYVIDDPELFAAYPELADMSVMFDPVTRDGIYGAYNPANKSITLYGKLYAVSSDRALRHEVQHAIQGIEGFARGGYVDGPVNPKKIYDDFSALRFCLNSDDWKKYQKTERDYWDSVFKDDSVKTEQLYKDLGNLSEKDSVKKAKEEKTRLKEKYNIESTEFADVLNSPYSENSEKWEDFIGYINSYEHRYKQYRRISGETESRNVEHRLSLPNEERRRSLAAETEDVARKDQIFLYQSFEAGKEGKVRGATIIHPDRTMRIELFKDANYSTFVHETAHFMLEVYGDLASDPQASTWIKNEYAIVRKYLGAKDGEAITREQHEKFARSFESYLMEGKAPSPELQGIFSRFKNWLLNIYRSMRGLNVNLNKDIREVFDRMLASDEEIAAMRDAGELQPLFATAEKMGIAQDEFDAYRKIGDSELIKAQDILRQKVMKAKLREKTKEYKEELEAEKKRVAKEYDRDPVVSAFNDLTSDNGFSLSEVELRRIYGMAFLSKLPKRNGKRIYSKDGQVSLEDLAESLDFGSGDALIRAIAQLPSRQEYIDDRARANLLEREGDILNSDTVTDEAENALHNEYMEERLKKELAILNRLKRAGKAAKLSEQRKRIEQRKEAKRIEEDVNAQVEAMEVAARSVIAEKPVKELKPNLYLRAMQKASRLARQALDKTNPDYTAAARQKQAEIMNNLLYKEANRVQKEIDRRTLQMKAIVRKPLKDAVKTRDSLFVNRAKYIAAKLGLGGNADVIMQRIRTEEQNRQDVEPFRYDLAAPLRELNTATALDVLEDVKANWDQARRDKVILIDGKRVEIDEAAKALSDKLADFGKTWRSSSRDDALRNTLLQIIGSQTLDHTRVEAWCDMVDGVRLGEETGPWMKYVFNPVKQAADKTRLSQDEYTQRLTDIIDGFQFTRETIEAPELGYTFGKDTGYGKAELIHAILHTGNMSNFQRLLVGRGWGSVLNGQVNAVNWNACMSRVIAEGRITEQDFDRVQQIWDLFDELKPQSQKAYKEVFGRYFDEITATPFFEFGKRYAGGYVPVIYDPRESGAGEKQLNPTMDLLNEMGTAFPRLQAGWGNSRKEGNFGPLLLDLSRLRDHISRQILFANMAPINKDVTRLLDRKNVSDTIRGYDPEFMGTVIKPWMSRSVTQNLEASGQKETRAGRYARVLRQRAGAITMFFSVTNTIEQVFDMTAAYSKVKGRYLTDAFRTMVSDRAGTVQAVMEASVYMRGRMSAEIMAANGRMEQALRPGRLKKANQWMIDHAYFMQTSVDKFCGTLTWVAAYNQATEAGLSHRDAVLQADNVVRQVFGANAAEDVSNFEAGGPFRRLFTQFTGYFVQRANLIAGEYSKIQRSDIANKKAAAAMLLLQTVLLPAWIGAALRKFAAGSDDDETFASWLLDVFGWGTFNYGLSMGGHVGQIANAAIDSYRGKSFSSGRVFYPPVFKMIEDAFKFRKWEDSDGDFDASKFIQDMAEIERIIPGLPIIPARPVATARYIYDVATDEVEPTGGYDFVRGVVTGRASEDSRR